MLQPWVNIHLPVTSVKLYNMVSSQLLRKLHRATTLKHPRTERSRANCVGVKHRYCSDVDMKTALHERRTEMKLQASKLARLEREIEIILENSWKNYPYAQPFMEQLLSLFRTEKLSSFDLWLSAELDRQENEGSPLHS